MEAHTDDIDVSLLQPKAAQAAQLLMQAYANATTNRHCAAAVTASLYNLLMKEEPQVYKNTSTPDESFAWEIRKSADRIQKRISNRLGVHCKSLHDAVHSLRTKCTVESKVLKYLIQLNATETMLKHNDIILLHEMEASVNSILDKSDLESASSLVRGERLDVGLAWGDMDGCPIFLDSLVNRPKDSTHICPAPDLPHTRAKHSPLFDPWAGSSLPKPAAPINIEQHGNAWGNWELATSKESRGDTHSNSIINEAEPEVMSYTGRASNTEHVNHDEQSLEFPWPLLCDMANIGPCSANLLYAENGDVITFAAASAWQQLQEPLQQVFVKVRGRFPQAYQAVLDVQNRDLQDGGSDTLLPVTRANLKAVIMADKDFDRMLDSISCDNPTSKELLRCKLSERVDVEVENMISFAIVCRSHQPDDAEKPLISTKSRLAPLTQRGMSQPRKQGKKR